MVKREWAGEVLGFWFEELAPGDWWATSRRTDTLIEERFGALHRAVAKAVPAAALLGGGEALAAVIVLDQFSRNIHRGTAVAFSADPLARAVAGNALACGFDQGLADARRQFLYMPFLHSEALADQERAVALLQGFDDETLRSALEHRRIIERFGRFPHRNLALGRTSTADEIAFLADHHGFGQGTSPPQQSL